MALPINVSDLINRRVIESACIEYKGDWNPEPILHSICAFANDIDNWGGGYIIIGIEEESGMPSRLLMKEKRSSFYGYRVELTGLINVLSLSQQKKPQNQKRYTISAKCPTASGQISWRKKSCLCWQITSPMMTAQIQQPGQRI